MNPNEDSRQIVNANEHSRQIVNHKEDSRHRAATRSVYDQAIHCQKNISLIK
ncbi:MAG: hypothetical protein JXR70_11480 [Spirochaetales bacterium]|nr:hypothetical protein [Spirochaetales bacterium]